MRAPLKLCRIFYMDQGFYIEKAGPNHCDNDATRFPQRFYRVLPLEALFGQPDLRVVPRGGIGSGAFLVRVLGTGGQPFVLHASSDLETWNELVKGVIIGDFFDFSDSEAINFSKRFYRASPLVEQNLP